MYQRLLKKPEVSFLLFGPRGTGKSTWLAQHFKGDVRYDLLDTKEFLRLEREPSAFYREIVSLPPQAWVVLDEVQKVPALMDEVHRLMEERGLRFVLCGSSARKLRRGGSNLLAGRAVVETMFPLVSHEMGQDFNVDRALRFGMLPMAVGHPDPVGFLEAYAMTYLNEEIRAEAIARDAGAFARFLEVAARQNAQVTNVSNIARDASVGRTTVQNYFEILRDTLVGDWIHPWKLKSTNKQIGHPKFYMFDPGVVRVLSGRVPYLPSPEETGVLLETLVASELRAYLGLRHLRYKLHFWRSYDAVEVDFLCETSEGFVAVEVKSSSEWRPKYSSGLVRVQQDLPVARSYGVYLGPRTFRSGSVQVLPAQDFLKALWNGEVLR